MVSDRFTSGTLVSVLIKAELKIFTEVTAITLSVHIRDHTHTHTQNTVAEHKQATDTSILRASLHV